MDATLGATTLASGPLAPVAVACAAPGVPH